jgi:hypothetical protein
MDLPFLGGIFKMHDFWEQVYIKARTGISYLSDLSFTFRVWRKTLALFIMPRLYIIKTITSFPQYFLTVRQLHPLCRKTHGNGMCPLTKHTLGLASWICAVDSNHAVVGTVRIPLNSVSKSAYSCKLVWRHRALSQDRSCFG